MFKSRLVGKVSCNQTLIAAVVFALAYMSNVHGALVMQYEVDNWTDADRCIMRMVLTNDGIWYQPVLYYDWAEIDVGLYDLSFDIANLGIGYSQQEILDAFVAVIEPYPVSEIQGGWSVTGKNEYGDLVINHIESAELWSNIEIFNDMVLTLSFDKKYLGPNATLILDQNYYRTFSVYDLDGFLHTAMTNAYRLVVPEAGMLVLILGGAGMTAAGKRNRLN